MYDPVIARDGRTVIFNRDALPGDVAWEVRTLDVVTNQTAPIPLSDDRLRVASVSDTSPNGRFLVMETAPLPSIVPTPDLVYGHVIHDRQTATSTLLSNGYPQAVNNDGRFVVVAQSDANYTSLYLLDRTTSTRTLITPRFAGNALISADGRFVAYQTMEVVGDAIVSDVASWDRTTRAERTLANVTVRDMSSDGRYLLLTPTVNTSNGQVPSGRAAVYDRGTATTSQIPGTDLPGEYLQGVGISDDGRRVLVNDSDGLGILDRQTGSRRRIDRQQGFSATPTAIMAGDGLTVVRPHGVIGPDDPTVAGFNPTSLYQGQQIELEVVGANLPAGSVLSAPGFTIGATIGSGETLRAPVAVAPDAPNRPVVFDLRTPAGCRVPGFEQYLEVTTGQPAILAISPPHVIAGRATEIVIDGFGFYPGIQAAALLNGVEATGVQLQVISHTETKLRLRVSAPTSLLLSTLQLTLTNSNGLTSNQRPLLVAKGSEYFPIMPERIFDSRATVSVGPGQSVQIPIRYNSAPSDYLNRMDAAVINLTATEPTSATYLTAYRAGEPRPLASSLNLAAGSTRANLVTVPVSANGTIEVFNAAGSTHVIVDLVGVYLTGSIFGGMATTFKPIAPLRWFDSRKLAGPQGPDSTRSFKIAEPGRGVRAVAINLTATGGTRASYLTAFGLGMPNVSTLNFGAGETVPNMAIVPVSVDGYFSIYNRAGSVHTVIDVIGVFSESPPTTPSEVFNPLTPTRVLDTRTSVGGHPAPAASGEAVKLMLTGTAGVPAGASSVVLNVTVTEPSQPGWVRVYPTGQARPEGSNLNFVTNQTVANMVMVPVGPDGSITLTGSPPRTHLVVDVVGWFGPVT